MSIDIDIRGLEELQRKLRRFPNEIDRIRREICAKYAHKIVSEAKDACPTEKMKESIRVVFSSNGDFDIKFSQEAKQYVEPIVRKNITEMHKEIERRIGDAWRT